MKCVTRCLLVVILFLGVALEPVWGQQSNHSQPKTLKNILASSQQMILVTTSDWNAVDGELLRYERPSSQHPWRVVGSKIPVVVGRNGLAWGKGLHGDPSTLAKPGDPVKKEGDGKAPAGIFKLSAAFGYASLKESANVKLPYLQATPTFECVDDVRSAYYNRLVDRDKVAQPDWNSSEQMRRDDELYRWGAVVDHNAGKPEAGAGSCIFLHIWSGAGKGTAGCTAMESARMTELLSWLDGKKKPVLVQFPQAELVRLRESLGLIH
ncbi:MAG TPA: hypothetical protein PLK30_28240 [Blastocatellia bacterium]|nr:hypothetical protein [Blastocatellia bacterium]